MNAVALAAVPVTPTPAAPANAPGNTADEAAPPGAFARELRRAAPSRDGVTSREERAERQDGAPADGRPAEAADGSAAPATGAATGPDATADRGAPGDPPALDVNALLAGWVAPNTAAAAPAPAAGRAAPNDAAADTEALLAAAAGATGGAPGTARGARAGAADTADAAAALPAGDAQAASRGTKSDATGGFALPTALPAGAAGAQGGAANTVLPGAADAARGGPVAERQLDTPLTHPGFAPALGAEVTLLVKDGVQHARLHLNPAEMGPITVQIQIEGERAQVTMSAEQAPTRQALEQALPALAGALRDSGLTLTGGGVFEQPRQGGREPGNGGGNGERPAAGAGRDGEPVAPDTARPLPAPRGVVDLYA